MPCDTLQGPGGAPLRGAPHPEAYTSPAGGYGPGPGPGPAPHHGGPGGGPPGMGPLGPEAGLPAEARPSLYVEAVPKDATTREMAHIFRPFPGFKVQLATA